MKKLSWRHHYLPIFYLKGFTNKNEQFKIYDVEQKRFIKNGKLFSPNSYFFEKNANTFFGEDTTDDNLETKFYSEFDSKTANLFEKINSSTSENKYTISENEMPILQHFVSLMYWRLPHKKNHIDFLVKNNNLRELGLKVKNKNKVEQSEIEKVENRIKNNAEFKKGLKFYLSLMDSIKGIGGRKNFTIIENCEGYPFLCSDNPVIFEKTEYPDVHIDNFIFPLTGNKLFIRADIVNIKDSTFRFLIDILLFKESVKYVSFTNEKYVDLIEGFFDKYFDSIEHLRQEIFDKLK